MSDTFRCKFCDGIRPLSNMSFCKGCGMHVSEAKDRKPRPVNEPCPLCMWKGPNPVLSTGLRSCWYCRINYTRSGLVQLDLEAALSEERAAHIERKVQRGI